MTKTAAAARLYFGTMLVMLIYNLILFLAFRDWNYPAVRAVDYVHRRISGLVQWPGIPVLVAPAQQNGTSEHRGPCYRWPMFGVCFSIAFLQLKAGICQTMLALPVDDSDGAAFATL